MLVIIQLKKHQVNERRRKKIIKFEFFSFNKNTNQSYYHRCFDYKFYHVNHCFISIEVSRHISLYDQSILSIHIESVKC
jgi:hypothetical protein